MKAMLAMMNAKIIHAFCITAAKSTKSPMDRKNMDEKARTNGATFFSSKSPRGREAARLPARKAPMDGVRPNCWAT